MASKLGSIYVEVRSDKTQFQQDMTAIRSEAKKAGRDIGVALGDGITGSRAERGIKDLSTGLMGLSNSAKVPATAFKTTSAAIASGFKEVANQIGITEKEYAALNEKMLRHQAFKQAESNLKNIARSAGMSATETKKLAIQMGYTSKQAKEMANNVTRAKGSVNSFGSSIKSLTANLLGLGAAYAMAYKAKELGIAVFESGQKALVAENAYKAITGSVKNANKEFEFLRETSDKLGLNFYTLRDSYKGFLAAAQNSKIPMEEVRNIFSSVSNAGAVMGLSNERMSLSFLALEQILSKGKVSMEELRRQLGDNLPGAFQIGAKAMGMTVEAFDKAVSAGEVYADDFLPKFRVAMEEAFQGTIADSVKAVNKLTEQWETMKIRMSAGGFMDSISNSMKTLTETLSDEKTIQSMTTLATALGNIAESAAWTVDVLGYLAKITMESGDYWGKFFYEPLKVANKELHSLNGALRGVNANLNVLEKSNRMGSERAKTLMAQKEAIEAQIDGQKRLINSIKEVMQTEAQQATKNKAGGSSFVSLPLDPLIAKLEKEKAEVKKTMAGIEEDVLKRIEKTDAAKLESLKKELAFVQKYGADKLDIINQIEKEISDIESDRAERYRKEQEKELKILQEYNQKKYQLGIVAADAIGKDSWMVFKEGQDEAYATAKKSAEELAEAKTISAYAFDQEVESMDSWISAVESGLSVQEADLKLQRERLAVKLAMQGMTPEEIVSYFAKIDAIEKMKDELKGADDILKKWKDNEFDFSFGDGDPFSKVLDSINEIIKASEKQAEVQEEINRLMAMGGEYAEAAAQIQMQANMDAISSTMAGYSKLFGALGDLYEEDSKERKALHQLEKGFAIAEIATNTVKAVTLGVVAIMNAMSAGDPYTAVARGLAVAATVASALSQIGAQFSMGGGGSTEPVKAENVTGSVLGDSLAVSESFKNSQKFLEDMHLEDYAELKGIHDEMRDLNTNIMGLVSNLFIGGVGFTSADMGINTSTMKSDLSKSWDKSQTPWADWSKNIDMISFTTSSELALSYALDKLLGGSSGGLTETITGWASDLGGEVAKVISGTSKNIVTAQGITSGAVSIGGLVDGGSGINAMSYADYYTKTQDPFWGGSSKKYQPTVYGELGDTEETAAMIDDVFTKIFTSIGKTFLNLGDILGANIETVKEYVFQIGKIDLKNLNTADEINSAISAYLNNMSDEAANTLFGELIGQYQRAGEGILETAIRVASEKMMVIDTIDKLGNAFESSDIPSLAIEFSQGLLEMAGGLENFIDITSAYYDKFYTDTEKQANIKDILTSNLSVLPDTREAYRLAVESIDLVANPELYIKMLELASTADAYYSYLEQAANEAESAAREAISAAEDASKAILDAVESSRASYYNAIASALSEAQTEQDKLLDALTEAEDNYNAVRLAHAKKAVTALEASMREAETSISDLQRLADSLRAYQSGLLTGPDSPLDPGRILEEAKSKFASASGDDIQGASEILLSAAKTALTDPAEYARLFAEVQNKVAGGISGAESAIDIAMRQVNAAESQITILEGNSETLQSLEDASRAYQEAQLALDNSQWADQITFYEEELARLDEITNATLSITEALGMYQTALTAAIAGGYDDLQASFAAELKALNERIPTGTGFANGGISTGPDSGYLALLHGNEMITPIDTYAPAAGNVGLDKEVSDLLRVLISEVRVDKDISRKVYRVLDRVAGGANSFQTRAED